MALMIGLDVGTSGVKGLLIDRSGMVLKNATSEYSMSTPKPLWCEQDPELWWRASCEVLKSLTAHANSAGMEIVSLGLTGQMHGLVLLDERGEVLRPCIMWNDQRTSRECQEITEIIGYEQLLEITGNPVLPGFTAPKILWVKKNEPEVNARICHILLPKDFIRYKISGEYYTDVSDASGTSLLNVTKRNWSNRILHSLGIPHEWLPAVVESSETAGRVTEIASELTGLSKNLPIAGGAGDQAAGAVGSGTVEAGVTSVVLGTSGVVFSHSDNLKIEPEGKLHAFCHAVPGAWHLMGVTLSAAGSFKWYRELNADIEDYPDYEHLTREAEHVSPGSEGVFFLPYLLGERTPYPDVNARGGFIGLNIRHKRAHLTRSVLEGVTYSLNDCLALIRNMNIPVEEVRVTGGGARSTLWNQIMADVFNVKVVTLSASEGAPFGAALLGGVSAGIYPDILTACGEAVIPVGTVEPDSERAGVYRKYYEVYKNLYFELKTTNDRISELVSEIGMD